VDILSGLNEAQKEAVLTTEGPVLILAGAGSGKTKALTHRIAYLMEVKKVSPYNILAVTFTNKAAKAMAERVAGLLAGCRVSGVGCQTVNAPRPTPYGANLPWLGTFHAMCVKILRREIQVLGYTSDFSIFDDADSIVAVKRAMLELKIDPKQYNANSVRYAIGGAKNEMVTAKEYEGYAEGHFQEIVCQVYKQYDKILKEANALDFDDLLNKTVEIFIKHPMILAKYQQQFKYLLVDEYQDTNHTQYLLCKMLASQHRNIFVIGDDYQSIYSWRGARFRNILDFGKDYPEAKIIKLEENYRSTQNILDAAQAVITKNVERSEKELRTNRGAGELVTFFEAPEGKVEIEFIIQEIRALQRRAGLKLKDFVILYRTNAQSRAIEEALMATRVPYRIIGGLRFYERAEIKDILAYLRLIYNAKDMVSLERIINRPARGIGPRAWSQVVANGLEQAASANEKILKFVQMLDELRELAKKVTVSELIEQTSHRSGYRAWLNDKSIENQSRLENIEELRSVAEAHNGLGEFLESVALVSDTDKYDESADVLTLMTLHSAKGLEFPVVFIIGMEEGLLPHSQSMTDASQLEEERRLCYVGMTRAKDRLYLTSSRCRLLYGNMQYNEKSRFLEDIPEELLDEIT
jgi:DNA helicase-2/ATP-dependent DNA helicase PcrA